MMSKTSTSLLLAPFAAALPGLAIAQGAEPCERVCLESFLDSYVDAVVAHDHARIPIADDLKFTENGQRLELGDGLWNTATGRGVPGTRPSRSASA